jgi:hypothetical protein
LLSWVFVYFRFWKYYQIYRIYIKNIDLFFYEENFEDAKEVIRSRESKDRKQNGQKKRNKRTNNELQNKTIEITKYRATRTSLKTEDELRFSKKVCRSSSVSSTYHVTLVTNLVISHEWGKENTKDISPFTKPHLSLQIYYPSICCNTYMHKYIGQGT